LLKSVSKAENSHKSYVTRISLMKSSLVKIASFETLQSLLFKSIYLVHFNSVKQLYIDLNVFKLFDFRVMIYHIKKEAHIKKDALKTKIFSLKFLIQSIMFLSRLLKSAEIHY